MGSSFGFCYSLDLAERSCSQIFSLGRDAQILREKVSEKAPDVCFGSVSSGEGQKFGTLENLQPGNSGKMCF